MRDVAWRTWPSSCATTRRTSAEREVLQQGVVEDDALGVAEPGHVGVGGGRAPRGVHHVDLADVDAGAAGEVEHVGPRLARRERLELVEERVEHDRPGVGGEDPEADHDRRARHPPAPAEAAHADDQQRAARGREERRRSPADLATSPAHPSQPWVTSPTSLARSARSRSPAAWRARPRPRSPRRRPPRPAPGRRPARCSRCGGRRTSRISTPPSISSVAPKSNSCPAGTSTAFSSWSSLK